MKKFIVFICLISVLATAIAFPSYAAVFTWQGTHGYDVLYYSNSVLNIVQNAFGDGTSSRVVNASPYWDSYAYKVVVSYDDLSAAVFDCAQSGIIVSLYKNTNAGYWVAFVTDYDTDFIPWTEDERVGGLLGNVDGYVYIAEIDTTADDTLSGVSNILSVAQSMRDYLSQIAFQFNSSNNVSNFASYIRDIKNLSDRTYGYVGTLVTKITDIHTQLTDSSTSGTMAQRLKNIDSSLGTIKAILGGQQTGTMLHGMYQRIDSINTLLTNWESTVTVDTSDLENMVSQSLAVIRGISNDTTDLVTLLDPTYQGQLTTLASYIVRICEAVESADSNITVDTSALETKIDDLHNSLNPYSDLSIAEMIGDWWVETRNSFADIDSDLNAMNGYLLTIDSSCRTINTNMVNLNGYITDDLEDIYGRLTGILSAVDGDNGSLNNGFATANGHLSNIKSYTNSIKSYTNSLNTNITDIETLLTNWEHPTFDTTALESVVSTFQTSVESDFDDLGIKVDTVATNVEAVTTALGTANSHLNTSKGYLKNIQSYTSNMKTNIADIETLLTNWEHPTFDTTALEGKVNDTNAYLSQISDKLDDLTESTVENITNITIDNDNDAYSVFYLTDENGEEESIAEFGGDVLTAGGKLLNFFFRVAFDDALSSVDSAVDGMTEFYFDSVTVGEGANIWE